MSNLNFDLADLDLDDLEVTTMRESIGRHGVEVPSAVSSCCSCIVPPVQPSAA